MKYRNDVNRCLTPEEYTRWFASRESGIGPRCALILAGGRSSRMGSDKPTETLGGKTLLERSAEFWMNSGRVDTVLVAVGQQGHLDNLPEGVIPVYDLLEARGPLAGIWSAFESTPAEVLYVSAVDMPNLSSERILPMPTGDAIVYVKNGRPEPLFGVYRRSIAPVAKKLLEDGIGKMGAMLNAVQTEYREIDSDAVSLFDNVNTPYDLMLARAGTPPMFALMGWSGSGKTTFLQKLLPFLVTRGIRVACIKHDAHGFEIDQPGKDTWNIAQAGASPVGIIAPDHWAIQGHGDITPEDFRPFFSSVDLIICEGFKYSSLPKIEVHRKANGKPFITKDNTLIAAITDEPLDTPVPQLDLNDVDGCAELIISTFHLKTL